MMICPHCFNPLSDEAYEQRVYDRCIIRVGQLEGENEKLRELVRISIEYCNSGTCDECPIQGEDGSCPYVDMARDLGIEVE